MSKKAILITIFMVVSVIFLWGAWLMEGKGFSFQTQKDPSGVLFVAELPPEERKDVIIECNEAHIQGALKEFHEFLDAENAISVPVPGGAMLLAQADAEVPPDFEKAKRAAIEVLKRHSPKRIIFISHSECLVYDTVAAWQDKKATVTAEQKSDLAKAKRVANTWFAESGVEMYYAEKEGNKLKFFAVK